MVISGAGARVVLKVKLGRLPLLVVFAVQKLVFSVTVLFLQSRSSLKYPVANPSELQRRHRVSCFEVGAVHRIEHMLTLVYRSK